MGRLTAHHTLNLLACQGLVLQKTLRQTLELFLILLNDLQRPVIAVLDELLHLLLHHLFGVGRHREATGVASIALSRFGIVDVAHLVRHAPLQDHGTRQRAGLLNIPSRAIRHRVGPILVDFRRLARHGHGKTLVAFVLEHIQAVHLGQAHHHTQRAAARNDRGLIDRIAFGQQMTDQSVTRFVIGRHFLLLGRHDHAAPLWPHHHFVLGGFKVEHRHETPPNTGRRKGRLVHKVRQIST
mmetsp:Transcript_28670/g.54132  ORF Transcript_28670/g.54132 Transcript_28670/m.54132 type:complete len:240 (+) Transcript_28670:178-897(+)